MFLFVFVENKKSVEELMNVPISGAEAVVPGRAQTVRAVASSISTSIRIWQPTVLPSGPPRQLYRWNAVKAPSYSPHC
jgi:hypothetical protein